MWYRKRKKVTTFKVNRSAEIIQQVSIKLRFAKLIKT